MNLIERAMQRRRQRGYDKTYWFIDLHDTVIRGTYNKDTVFDFMPYAVEVLRWLTLQPDHVLVLWTSSHYDYVDRFLAYAAGLGIKFNYMNTNPECPNTDIARFNQKPYFDILLDDKAGFNAATGWADVWADLVRYGFRK